MKLDKTRRNDIILVFRFWHWEVYGAYSRLSPSPYEQFSILLPPSRGHHFFLLVFTCRCFRCSLYIPAFRHRSQAITRTKLVLGDEMMNKGFFGQLLCCFRPNQVPPNSPTPGTNGSSNVHTETDYFSKVSPIPVIINWYHWASSSSGFNYSYKENTCYLKWEILM